MTKFIARENQELLWKMLNQTKTFSQQSDTVKIEMFKGTIERLYVECTFKNVNYQQLQDMNKHLITSILGALSKPPVVTVENTLTNDMKIRDHTGTVLPTPPGTHGYIIESSEEKAAREFQERQQQGLS